MSEAARLQPASARALPAARVLRIDSGLALGANGSALRLAVELHCPASWTGTPVLLACIPGGGMNRRYWDLRAEDGDASYSFAAAMTARGLFVLLVDPLGIGDSDTPEDGWALRPELLAQAHHAAIAKVCDGLRAGTLIDDLPALPALTSLGVGHSLGALLTVVQQARHATHAGIAVLGFGCAGLPDYLVPEARALIGDAEASRARLPALARAQFGAPLAVIKPSKPASNLFAGERAEMAGMLALRAAAAPVLAVAATQSMFPGNVAPEAAAITAPVFIGVGERDLTGPAHAIPASFTACHDLVLHVLPQAGHSHFLFPARHGLYARLAAWALAFAKAPAASSTLHC